MSGVDTAESIAVDRDGNVYVTGTSEGSGFFPDDIVTIKYSPTGQQLWVQRYDGDGHFSDSGVAVALDGAGNVYVAGSATGVGSRFYDCVVLKYAPNGALLWVFAYDGGVSGNDLPTAMLVDSVGNVYVAGQTWWREGSAANYDALVLKLDASGNLLWVSHYGGTPGGRDGFVALTLDSTGNLYATGFSDTDNIDYNSNDDLLLTSYNAATGTLRWVARYSATAISYEQANALAIDPVGNLYVAGITQASTSVPPAFTVFKYSANGEVPQTVKYDPNGNLLWAQTLSGASSAGRRLALDSRGDVYVLCSVQGDYTVLKYDSAGNPQWTARYNGPAASSDIATDLAVDSRQRVYVTGRSFGAGTSYDYATIKFLQIPRGDVNGDGCVDDSDLLSVLFTFGQSGANLPQDVNRDGVVDDSDLLIVLFDFGSGC